MTELIAMLTTGKGTWSEVNRLINDRQFERIYLLTNEFGKEKFKADERTELLLFDFNKPIKELVEEIKKQLEEKLSGNEVGVNFVSGTGKEHMALMGALMKLGLGFRLIALTNDGIDEV